MSALPETSALDHPFVVTVIVTFAFGDMKSWVDRGLPILAAVTPQRP
jgi:hypothetical protein